MFQNGCVKGSNERDAWPLIRHALREDDVGGKALLRIAAEMNETAHSGQKPLGDGKSKAKPARQAAASGIRLVKDVAHLRQLGIRHADAGIADIHDQIDAVAFPPALDANVDTALFREFKGVLQQDFEHMGNFLRVANKDRRNLRINVEHQLQMLAVALQGGHGNHVVQH